MRALVLLPLFVRGGNWVSSHTRLPTLSAGVLQHAAGRRRLIRSPHPGRRHLRWAARHPCPLRAVAAPCPPLRTHPSCTVC
eukprot:6766728-Alexandrium_andersonii.AAC.1